MSTLEVFCAQHIITHHWFVAECSSCHRLTDLCHEQQTIKLGVRVVCEDSEMNIGTSVPISTRRMTELHDRKERVTALAVCKTQLSDCFHRATTAVVNPEITVVRWSLAPISPKSPTWWRLLCPYNNAVQTVATSAIARGNGHQDQGSLCLFMIIRAWETSVYWYHQNQGNLCCIMTIRTKDLCCTKIIRTLETAVYHDHQKPG